jgi:hypothetical protein
MAQDPMGAYVGAGLGQFDYEDNDVEGFIEVEDTTLTYRVYGGYRFNRTWAVEGSYTQADDVESSSEIFPTITFGFNSDFEIVEVRGLAHLNAFFAGIGYWDADANVTLSVSSPSFGSLSASESVSDSGASVVLGGQWDLERVGIRVELEAYDMDDVEHAYNLGVGVHYRF